MPRPIKQNEAPNVVGNAGVKHPSDHAITVYSDYAVWDETAQKYIPYGDLTRKGK